MSKAPAAEAVEQVANLTGAISNALATVGIDLPIWFYQTVFLVLAGILFVLAILSLRTSTELAAATTAADKAKAIAKASGKVLTACVMGVIILGVLLFWGRLWLQPLPDHIRGRVQAENAGTIKLALIDSRGHPFEAGPPRPDSESGEFSLRYRPRRGDYPRILRISAPSCAPLDIPLTYGQLVSGVTLTPRFSCE